MGHIELVGLSKLRNRHDAGTVAGRIGDLAGIGLRIGDKLSQGVDRQARLHHQVESKDAQVRNRREIGNRIVRRGFLDRRGVRHCRRGAEKQRVTVGCRLQYLECRDRAVGSRPVLDKHRFAEGCSHMDRDCACAHVGTAACRKRHDETNRFGRPLGLRPNRKGQGRAQRDRTGSADKASARQ